MLAPEISGVTVSIADISDAGGGTTVTVAAAKAGARIAVMFMRLNKGTLDVSLLAEFGTTHQILNTAYLTGLLHTGYMAIRTPIVGPQGLALRLTATSSSALHVGSYEVHWAYLP